MITTDDYINHSGDGYLNFIINLDFQDEETDTILLTIVNNVQED